MNGVSRGGQETSNRPVSWSDGSRGRVWSGSMDNVSLVGRAADLLGELVEAGAALGWVSAPSRAEVASLMGELSAAVSAGDAALVWATDDAGRLLGLGYWRRYDRPTHRPHADLEKVAVAAGQQGRGIGRALVEELVGQARLARIEQLTLDGRADNTAAFALYHSLGFVEYGRLGDFVAVGDGRYDKVFLVLDLRTS
jgi:ribosomal protein S18 acetylase RimI-like enzyme